MSRDPFEFDDDATVVPGLGQGQAKPPADAAPGMPSQPAAPPASDAVLGGAAAPGAGTPPPPTGPASTAASPPARSFRPQERAVSLDGPMKTLGPTPLLEASAELLLEAGAASQMPAHNDVAGFRRRCEDAVKRFTAKAQALGVSQDDVTAGTFMLTSLVDDVVMATPWGQAAGWGGTSLSASVLGRTDGGEQLYQVAESLIAEPMRRTDLLGLLHAVFSTGFLGKLRHHPTGRQEAETIRQRLWNAYVSARPATAKPLSPRGIGTEVAYTPLLKSTPLWVFCAGFASIALAIYAALLFDLSRRGDKALAALRTTELPRAAASVVTPPPLARATDPFAAIEQVLAPDISAGRAELENFPGLVVVTLRSAGGQELFRSGGHEPSSSFSATFERVAEAASLAGGSITVEGHTDNQPLRSLRYGGSNVRLSEERAAAVGEALAAALSSPVPVEIKGYGADRPLPGVDQTTAEGRRLNRRVDILLDKK